MDVLVAGGHGKIALRLLRLLATDGHRARGLIRKPEQAADLEAVGAVAVLGDLEADASLAEHVQGADVVVFAAGAGPGIRPARKRTDDLGGAVKLVDLGSRGRVPRDDVAAVIAQVLDAPNTIGVTFEVFAGDVPVADAVRSLGGTST